MIEPSLSGASPPAAPAGPSCRERQGGTEKKKTLFIYKLALTIHRVSSPILFASIQIGASGAGRVPDELPFHCCWTDGQWKNSRKNDRDERGRRLFFFFYTFADEWEWTESPPFIFRTLYLNTHRWNSSKKKTNHAVVFFFLKQVIYVGCMYITPAGFIIRS